MFSPRLFSISIKRGSLIDLEIYNTINGLEDSFGINFPCMSPLNSMFLKNHNNQHNDIKYIMKIDFKNSLQLLDVLVSRSPNGSRVYWKPTHPNRYLHAQSSQYPPKNSQLLTLQSKELYRSSNPTIFKVKYSMYL